MKLADPSFHLPRQVDMLIGSGATLSFLSIGQINLSQGNCDLIVQKTQLGWVVAGGTNVIDGRKGVACQLTKLTDQIEKFWQLEDTTATANKSSQPHSCEVHYCLNTTRNADGRYVVRLPFRIIERDFGDTRSTALRRFYGLQKRFDKDPNFKQEYERVMNEYIEAGHMSLIPEGYANGYYMPHHAVTKSTSMTTKTRVVFDASAKGSKGISLNDALMTGPTIQDKLFEHLIRFRTHKYVLVADIEKMYRQILVHPDDRKYQQILWYNQGRISAYELNTVTFGVSSAPFLAIRTLKSLANDESSEFPIGAKILKRDVYVDDLITGAETLSELIQIRDEVIDILKRGKFNIRQWASNNAYAIADLNERLIDLEFLVNHDPIVKTLGLSWNARNDHILYTVKPIATTEKISKRIILSEIAKIFDPLGLIGPIIFTAKILMQDCWKSNITWDESVPNALYTSWLSFTSQFPLIDNLPIERRLLVDDAIDIQLHGFCDASRKGYGACLYVRSRNEQGKILVNLLCSRSRVAPIKETTIPRLELCGALTLTRMYREVEPALGIVPDKIIFWSDSTIVLNWLRKSPQELKIFEANRVSEIQNSGNQPFEWRHVRTDQNPADVLSRGQFPREFLRGSIWFHGPKWLLNGDESWPIPPENAISELPGLKTKVCLLTKFGSSDIFSRFSSYSRMIRVIAYCLRFLSSNRKNKNNLSVDEINNAELRIIKIIQSDQFAIELSRISNNENLKGIRIASFCPFINENGILCVGGRLRNANIPLSQKYSILLPSRHHVTDLIIREVHERNYHAGIQTTLYNVRYRFWLLDGKNQIRKIIRNCVRCIKFKATPIEYQMANLPKPRVENSLPFEHTGIDFFGPMYIKERKFRNRIRIKTYGCVYVCMSSKAVHIEIVSDLTTEAFLASLRRFIARRGIPSHIYSDNGTNFVGANNQLRDLYALFETNEFKDHVHAFALDKKITWRFNPPLSPHFGGIWEAAVKSFKHHFRRVVGDRLLTYEELTTLATEIEAILNSRPLCPLSADPNDPQALTPAHLLTGRMLTSLPENDYACVPENRLTTWQLILRIRQDFWKRWQIEYLSELQRRQKWINPGEQLKPDSIVILIDKQQPCMRWQLGRVTAVHPGEDGVIRVVTVRTTNGSFKRNATTLCPLTNIS